MGNGNLQVERCVSQCPSCLNTARKAARKDVDRLLISLISWPPGEAMEPRSFLTAFLKRMLRACSRFLYIREGSET
jgi:hypothetical protein